MRKLIMYVITFWIMLFAVALYASKGYACVDCDLDKEVLDSIKIGEVKIQTGEFEVDTGNEKFTVKKIKLNTNDENILKSDIKERFVTPDGQWCFVTIVIRQQDDEIIKREELHCSDTRYGITYKQEIEVLKKQIELEKAKKPGYWELFAEFYYSDDNVPLYCRKYAKPNSIFKRPGTVCLSVTGTWEVIK